MHLRTIIKRDTICTAYEPTDPVGGGRFPVMWRLWSRGTSLPHYTGIEGELYDLADDPLQRVNLWDDPARRRRRDELVDELRAHLPAWRLPPLPVASPS